MVRNPSRWRGREVKHKVWLTIAEWEYTCIYIHQTAPKQSWFTKSFSDCVKNNDTECLVKIFLVSDNKKQVFWQGWERRTEPGAPDAIFLRVLEAGDDGEGDDGGGHGDPGEGVQRGGRH